VNGNQSPCHPTQLGFHDFIYQHGEPTYLANKERFPGSVVAVVRNPLDFLVSSYHFFFKSRQNLPEYPSHPNEIAQSYLPLLVNAYRAFKEMDCLLLSYEELVSDTATTLTRIVRHYRLPVDSRLINLAVEHSSLKAAREYQQQGQPIHVGPHWRTTYVPGFRLCGAAPLANGEITSHPARLMK
jgi:hypothetical protein